MDGMGWNPGAGRRRGLFGWHATFAGLHRARVPLPVTVSRTCRIGDVDFLVHAFEFLLIAGVLVALGLTAAFLAVRAYVRHHWRIVRVHPVTRGNGGRGGRGGRP